MKWFHHDTDCLRNRKIRKVIRTHGPVGYAVWFALLEKLYEAEGEFQAVADEMWLEDLADDLKISDSRTLIRVFDTFAEVGLISSQLWQGEHILYCEAIAERGDTYIQKRMKEAEKKRKQRAKKPTKSALSPGDKKGTRGQMANVPPADPDLRSQNTDPDLSSIDQINYLDPPFIPPSNFEEERGREGEVQQNSVALKPQAQNAPQTSLSNQSPIAQFEARMAGVAQEWESPAFLSWLEKELPQKGDMHPSLKARSFVRNCLRYDMGKLQDYLAVFKTSGGDRAVADQDIQGQILKELQRLNLSAVVPDPWHSRTGVVHFKDLPSQDAAEYLAYLRSQGGAA